MFCDSKLCSILINKILFYIYIFFSTRISLPFLSRAIRSLKKVSFPQMHHKIQNFGKVFVTFRRFIYQWPAKIWTYHWYILKANFIRFLVQKIWTQKSKKWRFYRCLICEPLILTLFTPRLRLKSAHSIFFICHSQSWSGISLKILDF